MRTAMVLMALLAGSLPVMAQQQNDAAALEALKARISRTQGQLQQLQGEARAQERALREAETAIGQRSREIGTLEQRIRRQDRQLATLQQERGALQQARAEQQARLKAQLREAWQQGREQRLRVLFHQQRPETLSRTLTWYRYLNEARERHIARYQATLQRLDAIEPEILAVRQTLEASRQTLLTQQQQLAVQQAARRQVLAALGADIRSTDQQLVRLQRERQSLEALLHAVEESVAAIRLPADAVPFAQARGRLPWPASGRMARSFGSPRGSAMTWQGALIQAPPGSPVQAIHRGRVVFADWFRGMGLLLIVDHGDEFLTLYAHNQSLLKELGDWVGAGEVIATVGSSGGQADAGLYFEIRHKGRPENPARWCRRFG